MSVSRREFLKFTLAANGALLIGFQSSDKLFAKESDQALSPYFLLDKSNALTLHLSQTEMGQGISVALTALVAEELDMSPNQISIKMPSLDKDAPPEYKPYRTGGSYSVIRNWKLMREAASQVRAQFLVAAAEEWGLSVDNLETDQGKVLDRSGNREIEYISLADKTLKLPLQSYEFKNANEYKYVGKWQHDSLLQDKVSGSLKYALDVQLPNQKVAIIKRPVEIGAEPLKYDAAAAMKSPGVSQVIKTPRGVAVVADSYWQALKGVNLLQVEWSPGVLSQQSTDDLAEKYDEAVSSDGEVLFEKGAKPTGMKRLVSKYRVPYLAHVPMETMNCVASIENGRGAVWAPTQDPVNARHLASKVSGLAKNKVDLYAVPCGGGFGRRLHQDYVVEAVYLAARCNHPVKLIWPREDDVQQGYFRPLNDVHVQVSYSETGEITSLEQQMVGPGKLAEHVSEEYYAGAESFTNQIKSSIKELSLDYFPDKSVGTLWQGAKSKHYQIPHRKIEYHYCDAGVPKGFWRSVGHYPNCFAIESALDEVAVITKTDPFELRYKLLQGREREQKLLKRLEDISGWSAISEPKGMALFVGYNSLAAAVVTLEWSNSLSPVISQVYCVADCGLVINPDIVRAQLEGGIVFGISSVIAEKITLKGGGVEQSNFHDYQLLRFNQSPNIEIQLMESREAPGGVGELSVPLMAPAICNAIASVSERPKQLPLSA